MSIQDAVDHILNIHGDERSCIINYVPHGRETSPFAWVSCWSQRMHCRQFPPCPKKVFVLGFSNFCVVCPRPLSHLCQLLVTVDLFSRSQGPLILMILHFIPCVYDNLQDI